MHFGIAVGNISVIILSIDLVIHHFSYAINMSEFNDRDTFLVRVYGFPINDVSSMDRPPCRSWCALVLQHIAAPILRFQFYCTPHPAYVCQLWLHLIFHLILLCIRFPISVLNRTHSMSHWICRAKMIHFAM